MTNPMRTPLLVFAALALAACSSSAGSTTPSSTDTSFPAPTGGVEDLATFCALVVEGQGYTSDAEVAVLTDAMYSAISNATTDDDPAAIAAIQAWGARLGEAIDEFIPVYEELLTLTDDPTLSRAIELTLELNGTLGSTTADALVSVTSVSEYDSLMNTLTADTNAALEDPADQDALLAYNEFILENCGVSSDY